MSPSGSVASTRGRSDSATALTCMSESAWPATAAAAGAHYNVDVLAGLLPAEVSPDTEVWLDFELNERGEGRSSTMVPFVPTDGERAIVIHALPTSADGSAGARLACLPLTID